MAHRASHSSRKVRGWLLLSVVAGVALLVAPPASAQPAAAPIPWSYYFGGNAGATTFAPAMFGDHLTTVRAVPLTGFQGGFQAGFQGGGGFQGGFQGGGFQVGFQGGGGFNFGIPFTRGAAKIAENESPAPQDRVYIQYNYYSIDSEPDVHREAIGVEKALFGGRASVGLRLPFIQSGDDSEVGDLSIVLKYAPLYSPAHILSTGLVITAPTGGFATSVVVKEDRIEEVHPVQLQPYLGYLWQKDDFYLHGFASIMVPTDSDDVTVAFLDLGVGYWVFRGGGVLTGIVPTLEIHANLPVNHRADDDVPRFRDTIDLTGGVRFLFKERVALGMAAVRTLNSPRLFDFEVIANLDYRF